MENTLTSIESRFTITAKDIRRDDLAYITVKEVDLLSLLLYMKQELKMTHFVLLSAVDYIERNVFQLTYTLNNPDKKFIIALRVEIDREKSSAQSAHILWPTIATYQRELREMFGIDFPGSPNVNEEFMLEGWDDLPPYRRDFDTLKYAEETFFPRGGRKKEDPKEYMKKKLYGEWKKGE